jgi:Zn finger protein HypA/HybF involved in hydrogenase expression
MHEVSLVEALVEACLEHAGDRPVERVVIRHASTVDGEVVRQAFAMLTADGPLGGAALDAQRLDVRLACECGFDGTLGPDDEAGGSHVACPRCGVVHVAPRTPEIELLAVDVRA